MTPTLVIANKLYSSWSLRPWLLMRELAIPFEEMVIPLRRPETRAAIERYSPAGKVPVLVDGAVTVWDSLAICEHLAETRPEAGVWPAEAGARALARSISAEMHSGFSALRRTCPMDLGRDFAGRDRGDEVAADVARVEAIVSDARQRFGSGGRFLFGGFCAADAMYAPVVTRLDTYGFDVSRETRSYMDAILTLPSFRAWREAALREPWTLAMDETDDEVLVDHRARLSAETA